MVYINFQVELSMLEYYITFSSSRYGAMTFHYGRIKY